MGAAEKVSRRRSFAIKRPKIPLQNLQVFSKFLQKTAKSCKIFQTKSHASKALKCLLFGPFATILPNTRHFILLAPLQKCTRPCYCSKTDIFSLAGALPTILLWFWFWNHLPKYRARGSALRLSCSWQSSNARLARRLIVWGRGPSAAGYSRASRCRVPFAVKFPLLGRARTKPRSSGPNFARALFHRRSFSSRYKNWATLCPWPFSWSQAKCRLKCQNLIRQHDNQDCRWSSAEYSWTGVPAKQWWAVKDDRNLWAVAVILAEWSPPVLPW